MANILLRQRAIELRKQGKTYREIRLTLNVPKSTLSNWLQAYPLSRDELMLLYTTIRKNKFLAIEKTIITKQKKRQIRLDKNL